jgi:hypothetical protein
MEKTLLVLWLGFGPMFLVSLMRFLRFCGHRKMAVVVMALGIIGWLVPGWDMIKDLLSCTGL